MTSARTQNLYTYTGNNPVNMVDPTGHYASFLQPRNQQVTVLSDTGTKNPSPIVVPEPETTTDSSLGTVTLSDGRTMTSNDQGAIVPSLTELYYLIPDMNKDDSIDVMQQRPPRNFGDTGVYYIDFSYNVGPPYIGFTGGYSYVINTNEGWVAEYEHVGPYVGGGLSPLPASVQYTTGVVYGDMKDPTSYEGFFKESSFSIVGSYANAVSIWNNNKDNPVMQQGSGAETNVCASAGVNVYWLTNLIYNN